MENADSITLWQLFPEPPKPPAPPPPLPSPEDPKHIKDLNEKLQKIQELKTYAQTRHAELLESHAPNSAVINDFKKEIESQYKVIMGKGFEPGEVDLFGDCKPLPETPPPPDPPEVTKLKDLRTKMANINRFVDELSPQEVAELEHRLKQTKRNLSGLPLPAIWDGQPANHDEDDDQ
jgi:hypothetical protein